MAFIFTMRSTPIAGKMHQRDQSVATANSLPAISEDSDSFISPRSPPPVPPRAWNRPANKQFGFVPPYYDGSPPAYNQFETTVTGPDTEKLSEARKGWGDNRHIAKRGGWKRLALIALIVIIAIIALAVGLGVGLRKRHSDSSNSKSSSDTSTPPGGASGSIETGTSPTDNPSNATFPVGSYSFNTYLSTVLTNCTSNPATWMCYPYSTYAQNPSQSSATFDWIIKQNSETKNYTISSTDNIFSIYFTNASLSLMKPGTADEHYFFQLSMSKPTKPTQPLTSDNVAASCSFNDTTLQAYLYTKMEKTYPQNSTNHQGGYDPWPYAVKIEQVTGAGPNSPDCRGPSGQSLGDFSVSDGTQLCDCLYLNTGT